MALFFAARLRGGPFRQFAYVTRDQLALLSGTVNYLLETFQLPFGVLVTNFIAIPAALLTGQLPFLWRGLRADGIERRGARFVVI